MVPAVRLTRHDPCRDLQGSSPMHTFGQWGTPLTWLDSTHSNADMPLEMLFDQVIRPLYLHR